MFNCRKSRPSPEVAGDNGLKRKIFAGWFVVLGAHVLLALIFGGAYSFGAFFSRLQASYGAGSFSVASAFSLSALIYYTVGAFAGALADRFSTRLLAGSGILLLASGFFAASLAGGSLRLFILLFCCLTGLGIGLVYVPAVITVQRWFIRQRSKASGLTLAGTGLGTFIGPVVAGLLMQHFSWPVTMRIFALVIAVSGLAAAFLLHPRPAALGLLPDGDTAPADPAPVLARPAAAGLTLGEAVRGATFWCFFAAILLGSVCLFLGLVHIGPFAAGLGIAPAEANLLIGLIGAGNVGGRLFLGPVGDRIGVVRLLSILLLLLAPLNLLWLFATGFWPLALFAVLFGIANGGCISLFPAAAAGWFGTARLGAILGALYISVGIAALGGGSLGGLMVDLSGSYSLPIALGGGLNLLAAACLLLAGRSSNPKMYP